MSNRFLLIVAVLLGIGTFFAYQHKSQSLPQSSLYVNGPIYVPPPPEPERPVPPHPAMQYINLINARNSQIRSINYRSLTLRIKKDVTVSLNGSMAYEKEKRFRMKTRSFMGRESDVGSNDSKFWFWSKRMEPSLLYYCDHENTHRSRLRTPFHPAWMRETIGIDMIDTKDVTIIEEDGMWQIFQQRKSVTGKKIVHMTLIDKEKILGRYIYTPNGDLVISSEVKEFYRIDGHIVSKINHIYWAEEDVVNQWIMNKPDLNSSIDPRMWQMPNMRNSIDLGKPKFWCESQE